jgi:hypothetical protein
MVFHGQQDHGHDYLVTKLLFISKGNLATLTKDKPSQPHVPSGIQQSITFSDVKEQIDTPLNSL